MTIKRLLKSLLNVNKIKINNCEFNTLTQELYIYASLTKGQRNRCPICHRKCKGYDTITPERKWRSLDFGPVKVFIVLEVHRVVCKEHGILSEDVPFAYHRSNFTKEFERQVAYFALHLTKADVCEIMRINWRTVGDILKREKDRIEPDSSVRCKSLRAIGIDETSYKKGHKYLTVIVNHDNNEVIWCHKGHGKEVFEKFFSSLDKEDLKSIKLVSADGARWIKDVCNSYLDDYDFCIDRYHVTEWCIETLEELRKEVWRNIKDNEVKRSVGRPKKGEEVTKAKYFQKPSKYALGKNPENLTYYQKETLILIEREHPRLYRGYLLKESLRNVFDSDDPDKALKDWIFWASHSKLEPFKELSKKIRRHKEAILATCKYKLSNARIEATNNKIKVLIRKAYGFRNIENLISLIMISCSNLINEIRLPYKDRLIIT